MVYICIDVELRERLHELSGARLPVLICIALHSDGSVAWPTFDTIMQETGLARASIAKAIAALEAGGWITVTREHRKQNVYRLQTAQIHMNGNGSKTELKAGFRVQKLNSTGSKTELNVVQKLNSTGSKTELQEDTTEEDTKEEDTTEEKHARGRACYSADFEAFWSVYPRHDNKAGAWRVWRARRRDGVRAAAMTAAARNYADYCRAVGTEQRYVKHAATFIGPDRHYDEWAEPRMAPAGAGQHRRGGFDQMAEIRKALEED